MKIRKLVEGRIAGGLFAVLLAWPMIVRGVEVNPVGKVSGDVTAHVPPPPIVIYVTAPDWNLGDLPRGEGTKAFAKQDEKLCFTYDATNPAIIGGKKFLIDASNENGVVGGRYRLRNTLDGTQFVPYTLLLSSGEGAPLSLPNNTSTIKLGTLGQTCFSPTFKTTVDKSVKAGDYKDVLTFTIVTRT